MNNPSFTIIPPKMKIAHIGHGATIHFVSNGDFLHMMEGTFFAYVMKGQAWYNSSFPLRSGMYGCFTSGTIAADAGARVFLVQADKYDGMRMFGGPIEAVGRLKYIDGCTDSLLVPPVKLGDPCLNHLHFPTDIDQTMHTHPSVRVGVVARGQGECVTPWGVIPMTEGTVFIIHPENGEVHQASKVGSHAFRTRERTMDIIAWHPDSDFGPTDEVHPMINRTIVDGVSARHIESIRTK